MPISHKPNKKKVTKSKETDEQKVNDFIEKGGSPANKKEKKNEVKKVEIKSNKKSPGAPRKKEEEKASNIKTTKSVQLRLYEEQLEEIDSVIKNLKEKGLVKPSYSRHQFFVDAILNKLKKDQKK